jgi:hypothetical protein
LDTASWIPRLVAASTVGEVLHIVNDYVAARDPAVIANLPLECALKPMATAEDVAACAYRLAAYHSHGEDARTIQRLSNFFARASIRIAELTRR